MIEGPDPYYFDEFQEIPQNLIDLMIWGMDGEEDERDKISDWLNGPVPERLSLLEELRGFLARPPSEFQLYALMTYRNDYMNEAELLLLIQDICRRLELSLQAAP